GKKRRARLESLKCEGGTCPNRQGGAKEAEAPCNVYRVTTLEEAQKNNKYDADALRDAKGLQRDPQSLKDAMQKTMDKEKQALEGQLQKAKDAMKSPATRAGATRARNAIRESLKHLGGLSEMLAASVDRRGQPRLEWPTSKDSTESEASRKMKEELQHRKAQELQVDHLTPRSAGGCPDNEKNVVMHGHLCANCRKVDSLLDT